MKNDRLSWIFEVAVWLKLFIGMDIHTHTHANTHTDKTQIIQKVAVLMSTLVRHIMQKWYPACLQSIFTSVQAWVHQEVGHVLFFYTGVIMSLSSCEVSGSIQAANILSARKCNCIVTVLSLETFLHDCTEFWRRLFYDKGWPWIHSSSQPQPKWRLWIFAVLNIQFDFSSPVTNEASEVNISHLTATWLHILTELLIWPLVWLFPSVVRWKNSNQEQAAP